MYPVTAGISDTQILSSLRCLGLSMLECMATEGHMKKENMTPKQFYDNLQRLKAAGLVRRKIMAKPKDREHDGNYYEITSLGKLVYLAIKDIRKAAARSTALKVWDNIKNDSMLTQKDELLATLIPDEDMRKVILAE
jgi:DNA-binding PadR family transcriptional regulator